MLKGGEVQGQDGAWRGLGQADFQGGGDAGEGVACVVGCEGEDAAFPEGEEGLGARGEESGQVGLPEGSEGV